MALRSDDLPPVAQLRLFAGFPEPARDRLLERALVQRFPKATLLFAQGDLPDFLHVLLEGGVELVGSGQGGRREAAIDILEPVDMFIPAAVLTATPYLMSARVIEPARVLLLPAARLRGEIGRNPELALAMLATMSRQFRRMVRQLKDLKLRTATQRLGCYLLTLAERQGDTGVVVLPYGKKLIASRLGMTPENLSRSFAQLRAQHVTLKGNRVTLGDLDALRAAAPTDPLIDHVEAELSIPVD